MPRVNRKISELNPKEYYTPDLLKKLENYQTYLENNQLPLPNPEQVEWLDDEIGMFCHFSINTFYNKEWSDGTLAIKKFNPVKLDVEQWVKVAKDMGAKYMVATAKHHDGFCVWPTMTTEYSIKNTPFQEGKGDVIRDFVVACKKYDMKIGLYLSPWDRHQERFGCYRNEEAYDEFYCQQLTELLTWYDAEITYVWFDGAGSEGHQYNWKKIINVIKKNHPKALIFGMGDPTIRWVGNEFGYSPYPMWYVLNSPGGFDEMATIEVEGVGLYLRDSDGFGNRFIPPECDVPIRRFHWFYHTHDKRLLKSLKQLIFLYDKSVGRGTNLLLNLAPNREGLIDPPDAKRAKELGNLIQKRYSKPIREVHGVNGQVELELDLDSATEINCVMIQEDIEFGQRIREYELQIWEENSWKTIKQGISIGHKKIDHIKAINTSKLRIKVTRSLQPPNIKSLSVFSI